MLYMPVLHDYLQTSLRCKEPWQGTLNSPLPCTSRYCKNMPHYSLQQPSRQCDAGFYMPSNRENWCWCERYSFPGRGFSFLEGWALHRFQ